MSTLNHNLFWRERRAEAVSNRGPSAYQPNALPLGQTGSQKAHNTNDRLIIIAPHASLSAETINRGLQCVNNYTHAKRSHTHVSWRSCSPRQNLMDYGNTKTTLHALKVSESSLRMSMLNTIQKKKKTCFLVKLALTLCVPPLKYANHAFLSQRRKKLSGAREIANTRVTALSLSLSLLFSHLAKSNTKVAALKRA